MDNYPKVLIVGECFNNRTGAGITMSNLFRGWTRDKITVVTEQIDKPDLSITNRYYLIGSEEKKRPWPFNYFRVTAKSGYVEVSESIQKKIQEEEIEARSLKVKSYLKLNYFAGKIFSFFGFYHFIYKFSVSKKLLDYVDEFKPDIIYSHLHYLEFMQFVHELHLKTKIPLVVHMMDDWLKAVEPNGLFKLYWQNKTEKVFTSVIKDTSSLMSICSAMSEDYQKRYGENFIPFHNPVETETWMVHSKTDWSFSNPFRILYAGRIGVGTRESVVEIADAVESLNQEGQEIVFEIQTRSKNNKFDLAIKNYKSVKLVPTLEYSELPEKFASVDLLVLPMDFDNKSLKYIWLSMPTKTSEYLSTGTPILVYAPAKTAIARYAVDKKWGVVVTDQNQSKLQEAIRNICNDYPKRKELGERGKELTIKYHDAKNVREEFRKQLASLNANHKSTSPSVAMS